jgi:tRNA(Ile)-lysidine synthase
MRGAVPNAADLSQGWFAALMAPLGPFPAAARMVAGVSGGPHSLALFLLLRGWGADIRPVIVDHGLRSESGAEADHVAVMLAGQGASPRVMRLRLAGGAGLQARARQARLAALTGVAAEEGRPWIALGHHSQDQAETILLRLEAGSGEVGLAGMAAGRAMRDALLIRPLLSVPPARLEAVVAAAGLVPIRDPSNDDPRFARIRARSALTPVFAGALLATAKERARRRAYLEREMAARLAESGTVRPEGYATLDRATLGTDDVACAALAALIRIVGGGEYAPGGGAVRGLLARGSGSLGGAVLAASGVLTREVASLAPPLPAETGCVWDNRWRLNRGAAGCAVGPLGTAMRARHLPAAVVAGLPALWRDGTLVAAPALGYAQEAGLAQHLFTFEPMSGPMP